MCRLRLLAFGLGIFALALLAPLGANAQVTVFHARVTLSPATGSGITVSYCDQALVPPTGTCDLKVWDLGSGVALAPTQTLVLTQTGTFTNTNVSPNATFPNFDTSDRINKTATPSQDCNSATPCAVTIQLDTGAGLTTVFSTTGGNALNNFNGDSGATGHPEGFGFNTVAVDPNFTVGTGYADSEHSGLKPVAPCTSVGPGTPPGNGSECVPNPWDGTDNTTAANFFKGAPVSLAGNACDSYCFDAGAVLITAKLNVCPLTQGFWKNHPDSWPVGGLTIGGTFYTKAQLIDILQTPPAGGNAVLILGHQLIAAELNILNGTNAPASIFTAISQASALIGGVMNGLNGFVQAGTALGQQMTALGDTLDNFNSGGLTPVCTGPR